jgi:hypothetical protein
MNQAGHIFAKDARHLRWEIAISLALVAAYAWTTPSGWLPERFGGEVANVELRVVAAILSLLVPVSWWILITRLVQDESLVGDQQWWITKPYEWTSLLGAKLLFLLTFVLLPLFVARCVVLAEGGFRPFGYLPGVSFGLMLMTGAVVVPLIALAAVTSSFGRMTLTLLGIFLAVLVVMVLMAFADQGSFSAPAGGIAAFVVIVVAAASAIVLQYARRRVWVSRLVLAGGALLMAGAACLGSLPGMIANMYPRGSAPLQLALDTTSHTSSLTQYAGKDRVGLSVPVTVSGIAEGTAVNLDADQLTVVAQDGRQWSSTWENLSGARYLSSSDRESLPIMVKKAFYEQERALPVTLRLRFAVTELKVDGETQMAMPGHEFVVPSFGICTPAGSEQMGGMECRAPLHQPRTTFIHVQWSDAPCEAGIAGPGVAGEAWAGNVAPPPAEFGIDSVTQIPFALSNNVRNAEKGPDQPRSLCPGSPVSFTRYALAGRSEYDVTLANYVMPEMPPVRTAVVLH